MEFPNRKYDGLHIPNLLSIDDEKILSDLINCDIFNSLFISKRIGSESQIGTIWLCSLKTLNFSFIIKVQSNRNKAHLEFRIQNYLSHTWSHNFLITYGSIDCPEVSFRDKGEITTIKTGNFIFMETAIGDLSQVIKYSIVDEKMLTGYILDVIDAVEIMTMTKVFHGDLHIRQIFIVLRNITGCELSKKAVIGDFGEYLQIESPTMHLSDLKIFFKSLLEIIHVENYVENSQKFILKISKCLEFISQEITRIEIKDLSYDTESIKRDITQMKSFISS